MAQTIVGYFKDDSAAQKAVEHLISIGVARDRIQISRSQDFNTDNVENKTENSVSRFFKSVFSDNGDTDHYENIDRSHMAMVSVQAQSSAEAQMAASLLDESGAVNVEERMGNTNQNENNELDEQAYRNASIQRIQEDVSLSQQERDKLAMQKQNRDVSWPANENRHLSEGNDRDEKNPYDGGTQESRLQSLKEGSFELTEYKEVPVIHKEERVVEEIRIRTDVEERDETVYEKVRGTDLDVQKIEGKDQNASKEVDYEKDFNIRKSHEASGDGYNMNNRNTAFNERDDLYNGKVRREGDPLFGA